LRREEKVWNENWWEGWMRIALSLKSDTMQGWFVERWTALEWMGLTGKEIWQKYPADDMNFRNHV